MLKTQFASPAMNNCLKMVRCSVRDVLQVGDVMTNVVVQCHDGGANHTGYLHGIM